MTFDTTPLERDCVLLNCSKPAVAPLQGHVYCAGHDPNPPARPPEPAAEEPPPARPPALPDMATMEPVWDGTQFVLRQKTTGQDELKRKLETVTVLVRELMFELGIPEADR